MNSCALRDLKARDESLSLSKGNDVAQIIPEFEEIEVNIISSTLAHVIAAELKRLKTFLHKRSYLLNRSDIGNFYSNWIEPFEIHLECGASLDLRQAQYEQLKAQFQINLLSEPMN